MVTMTKLQLCGERRPIQENNHLCIHQCRLARWKHVIAGLEFAKRHLRDTQTMRNKVFWSDELFNLNAKCHVWKKPGTAHHQVNTIPKVKHGGFSNMLWEYVYSSRVEGKMNAAMHRDILDDNLLQSFCNKDNKGLSLGPLCECP